MLKRVLLLRQPLKLSKGRIDIRCAGVRARQSGDLGSLNLNSALDSFDHLIHLRTKEECEMK